ncbi:MAG: hypothetical protein MUC62_08660 [Candidatus Thermoplasmatota archaeon]|jgi:hypothetical protein|nr:hypothetical protein [Candidatus Thermoplasmatota archaeon]
MSTDPNEDDASEMEQIKKRMDVIERELRLVQSGPSRTPEEDYIEFEGGFFEVMKALKALYPGKAEDNERMLKISDDIEKGNIRIDMTELFFRFFVRQEINNARIKLLLLSQKLDLDASLFDQLDDLSVLIDDPRYSVHQVIIGWRGFERNVSNEIARLRSKE